MPEVSVILSVYNGTNYLEKSVTSVLAQNFTDFKFLILDNCSTDGTWDYLQTIKDKRVELFRNENTTGVFANFNFLINQTNTSLIKLWAHDDIMYPHCLQSFVAFHKKYPAIGFSYSGRDVIDENGLIKNLNVIDHTPKIISPELHSRIAFFTGSIAGNVSNVMLTRQALDKVGLFNELMKISGDFDMWVRIARYFSVGFINVPLIQLRDHKKQLSRNQKFYINHLREDVQVYKYLLSYVTPKQGREGRILLRNYKLLFYYTLMIKAFLKGSFKSAWQFCFTLSRFDNIFLLTAYFIKNRIFLKRKYTKQKFNNAGIILPDFNKKLEFIK